MYLKLQNTINEIAFVAVMVLLLIPSTGSSAAAQKNKPTPAAPSAALLRRTTSRHEVRRFGYAGTVTVVGAPQGSITIEGWARSEFELSADIELQGASEADLDRLAALNNFLFDDNANHISILTTGTHDKAFMKRAGKNFPKQLLALPWKIDYRLRVPAVTDLEIDAGVGAINVSGVEGAIRITAPNSEATLTLTGGTTSATFAVGKVTLHIPVRSWRGPGAQIQVAAGELAVELPPGFNGDIDADVLRTGHIDNSYVGIESREAPGVTARTIRGRAGAGGAAFKFTVGDGTICIKKRSQEQ